MQLMRWSITRRLECRGVKQGICRSSRLSCARFSGTQPLTLNASPRRADDFPQIRPLSVRLSGLSGHSGPSGPADLSGLSGPSGPSGPYAPSPIPPLSSPSSSLSLSLPLSLSFPSQRRSRCTFHSTFSPFEKSSSRVLRVMESCSSCRLQSFLVDGYIGWRMKRCNWCDSNGSDWSVGNSNRAISIFHWTRCAY